MHHLVTQESVLVEVKSEIHLFPRTLGFGDIKEYLGSTSQSVSTLSHGDVEDELLDFDVPHRVLHLLFRSLRHCFQHPITFVPP